MKKKNMSLKTTTALILIVFLLGLGGVMFYYAFYKVAYITEYDILIKTSEGKRVGLNADPTLHFGKIPAEGGVGTKEIILANEWDIPLLLQIRVKGDAAQFIRVKENNFIMPPRSVKHLWVYAVIPNDHNIVTNYTGNAKIIYFRT